MAMDVLRSCYASSMAPYSDKPGLVVPGAWHWAPPGARFLPFPTAFCSGEWDPWQVEAPHLGEQPPRGAYSKGPPIPAFQGRNFCGSADVWQNGQLSTAPPLPVDANGIPVCCQPQPYNVTVVVRAWGGGSAFV